MHQPTQEGPNGQQNAYYTPTSLVLRQAAAALYDAGQALDSAGRLLLKLANDSPEPAPSETAPLRGAELRRIIVEVAQQVSGDAWPIHYRDWFAMVERAGYPVVVTFIDGRRLCASCLTNPAGPDGAPGQPQQENLAALAA